MGYQWNSIPADVFMAILRRIHMIRRLRFVCRHWRDVIDERMPEARFKLLAFIKNDRSYSCAFVIDDPPGGPSRKLDLSDSVANSNGRGMIGTCNGLLCLRHDYRTIAVINPTTREMITLNTPNTSYQRNERTYSFGCHPATGQYKILHFPCDYHEPETKLDVVHVFTLGDQSWRKVRAPAGSSCEIRFGFVTVDGVTYWVSKDAEQIMSFDLKNNRVALFQCPPMPEAARGTRYSSSDHHQLTEVRGRLGVLVSRRCPYDETEVWVLESEREEGGGTWVKIASPQLVHGELILTPMQPWWDGMPLRTPMPEPEIGATISYQLFELRTFAYAETREDRDPAESYCSAHYVRSGINSSDANTTVTG